MALSNIAGWSNIAASASTCGTPKPSACGAPKPSSCGAPKPEK